MNFVSISAGDHLFAREVRTTASNLGYAQGCRTRHETGMGDVSGHVKNSRMKRRLFCDWKITIKRLLDCLGHQ